MIAGIVASQAGALAAPESALVELDFVNGVYSVAGVLVTAAEILDHPEWIGVDGLAISYANETTAGTAVAHLIGDALAALLTLDWTIVYEYQEFYAGGTTLLLSVANADWESVTKYAMLDRRNTGLIKEVVLSDFDFDNSSLERTRGVDQAHGVGIHRIAATRTGDKLSISVNGSSTFTYSALANPGVAAINATIGSRDGEFLYNDFNCRYLAVYPPQNDGVLGILSAG